VITIIALFEENETFWTEEHLLFRRKISLLGRKTTNFWWKMWSNFSPKDIFGGNDSSSDRNKYAKVKD